MTAASLKSVVALRGPKGDPGEPGTNGTNGAKGDPGQGLIQAAKVDFPAPAACAGSLLFDTSATGKAAKFYSSDGDRMRKLWAPIDITDFGADPTGGIGDASSDAVDDAIELAASIAVAVKAFSRGGEVYVPPGDYYLSRDVHLHSGVRLVGEHREACRLTFAKGKGIFIDGQATGPANAYGTGRVERVEIYGDRPDFEARGASAAQPLGRCTRKRGDNRGYWECVRAGVSGATLDADMPTPAGPFLLEPWRQRATTGYRAACTAGNGRLDVWFVAVVGFGAATGAAEPAWDFTPGNYTVDGGVTWLAVVAGANLWFDGTAVWACRMHAGVLQLVGGKGVDDCTIAGFANAGIAIIGDINSVPYTNANNWQIGSGSIIACGIGVYVAGGDSNAGSNRGGLTIFIIGYEPNQVTPIPYDGDVGDYNTRTRTNSGGYGVWDNSFLGCVWVGVLCETTEGRGFYAPGENSPSKFIGCYSENGAFVSIRRGSWDGGINTSGFEPGLEGHSIYGAYLFNFNVGLDASIADGVTPFLSPGGLTPVWFGWRDAAYGNSAVVGWRKGYAGIESTTTVFGYWSSTHDQAVFGVQGPTHPEGVGFRVFEATSYGHTTTGHVVDHRTQADVTTKPGVVRRGQRKQGDRAQPTTPWQPAAGGPKYESRHALVAGYEGRTWQAGLAPWWEGNGFHKAPELVVPTDPANDNVYIATNDPAVVTGPTEPNWALAPNVGDTVAESGPGGTVWRNKGKRPKYGYAGLLEHPPQDTAPTDLTTYTKGTPCRRLTPASGQPMGWTFDGATEWKPWPSYP